MNNPMTKPAAQAAIGVSSEGNKSSNHTLFIFN